jgi:hypothetical protein
MQMPTGIPFRVHRNCKSRGLVRYRSKTPFTSQGSHRFENLATALKTKRRNLNNAQRNESMFERNRQSLRFSCFQHKAIKRKPSRCWVYVISAGPPSLQTLRDSHCGHFVWRRTRNINYYDTQMMNGTVRISKPELATLDSHAMHSIAEFEQSNLERSESTSDARTFAASNCELPSRQTLPQFFEAYQI